MKRLSFTLFSLPFLSLLSAALADDSFETATPVSVNSSVAGSFSPADDVDFYRIDVNTGGILEIYTTGSSDTVGDLFDGNETFLTFGDDEGDEFNFKIRYEAVPGTYYILVTEYSGDTGDYTLFVNLTSGDGNDGFASASIVGVNSVTAGTIEVAADRDYYRIEVPETGTLNAFTTGSLDTIGELYDGNGFLLAYPRIDDISYPDNNNFDFGGYNVSAGTYFISVGEYGPETGSYSLSIEFTAGPNDGNDSFASADPVDLNSVTPSSISDVLDVDFFRFNVPLPGTITVSTSGGLDTGGDLFNQFGSWLDFRFEGGEGNNFLISMEVDPGVHYIRVAGFSELDVGNYSLNVNFSGTGYGDFDPFLHTYTSGYVNTGSWLGWTYVDTYPYVYSVNLNAWLYAGGGDWFYIPGFEGPGTGDKGPFNAYLDTEIGGYVDTGNWISWTYVATYPWVWNVSLNGWLYSAGGGWFLIP
jgi:hypothetical protein